jgi:hypothetical protein
MSIVEDFEETFTHGERRVARRWKPPNESAVEESKKTRVQSGFFLDIPMPADKTSDA